MMCKAFRRRLAALPAVVLAASLPAQQTPTFSTDVNVVNLLATARDKDGHIVSNLGKDDFTLQEDGRPQTIKYFSRETDLPLTLGLLVDTSLSQRTVIGAEKTATSGFVHNVLREDKDKAFLVHFDREVELLQDLTSSRAKLDKAVQELEVAQPSQQSGGGGSQGGGGYPGGGYPGGGRYPGGGYPGGGRHGGGGGGMHRGGGTALYDAILLASDELMKKQTGRKPLIVLSDGVDRGSKVSITEAIEHAQRSDSLVYAILFAAHDDFGGFGGPGMGRHGGMGRRPQQEERPDGKKIMERLAKETGGSFFEVSKKHPIDQIYSQIQEELRSQYSLGYVSDQPSSETGYRKITLATNRKNITVQTRDGYYPALTKSARATE
jgi:VWFA-related protein